MSDIPLEGKHIAMDDETLSIVMFEDGECWGSLEIEKIISWCRDHAPDLLKEDAGTVSEQEFLNSDLPKGKVEIH